MLNGDVVPFSDHIQNIVDSYRDKLEKQLKARKLKQDTVSAFILEFEQAKDPVLHRWVSPGKPYILSVTIRSNLGHIYNGRAGGYCNPHDKTKEQRRNGF